MAAISLPYEERRQAANVIPTGDLRLRSGRFLGYLGAWPDVGSLLRAGARNIRLNNVLAGGVWDEARKQGLRIIASLDRDPVHGILLHVSCSYADHEPTWRDIRDVRDTFFPPDIDVMMVLPQAKDYANDHPFAHHLWSMPFEWGIQ